MTTSSVLHKPGATAELYLPCSVLVRPEAERIVDAQGAIDCLQYLQEGAWTILSREWSDELPNDMGTGWHVTARYDG